MRYDGLRSASTQIAFPIVRPKNMDGLMADAMMVFLTTFPTCLLLL